MKGYLHTALLLGILAQQGFASDQETKTNSAVKAPFHNYWDANTWEKDSGSKFWHAGINRSKSPMVSSQAPNPKKPLTADGRSTPPPSSLTETQSALHRRSEK